MKSSVRYTVLFILLLSVTIKVTSQDNSKERFDNGVELFTGGNVEEALQIWNDLYTTGYRSANLLYNIGNAHFKLNNIPEAILFYERAYLLAPADEDINYNLQVARILVVDRFNEIPELFFVRWYNLISLLLPTNGWAIISIISFILSLAMLSLYIYSSGYRLKVSAFWFAVLLLMITLSSLAFSVRNKRLVYDSNNAIITSPIVRGKSSPDESGTDLFVLHEGTKVSVEDEVGEWYEIRLSDGNLGWIPSGSCSTI